VEKNYNYDYNPDHLNELPRLAVAEINDREVIYFVKKHAPDLIIIKGVSIFKAEVLEALNIDIVNIHSGWLPDYRGIQCGTWPLVKNDFNKLGVTFHVGEWRAEEKPAYTYEVYEGDHWITHEFWGGYVRHNIIRRKVYDRENKMIEDQFVTENHSIMMYQPFLESGYHNEQEPLKSSYG